MKNIFRRRGVTRNPTSEKEMAGALQVEDTHCHSFLFDQVVILLYLCLLRIEGRGRPLWLLDLKKKAKVTRTGCISAWRR